ncbi:MAG: tetratricopeptide repeat protein, partial [Clostridia bacterium]|nr:tetratricopeptide repeat protein [Clostridia bacterium]
NGAESQTVSFEEMAQHHVLVCQIMAIAIDTAPKARLCHLKRGDSMKSDLTCPIEVMHVDISHEPREDGKEQVVCTIEFHSLEPDKTVDSVQMNIVCFSDDGMRLGGRLVRAHAHDRTESGFVGTFRPEHVNGTTRVEASVEKVWFNNGIIWRREERNVREYQPNQLPEGRELDRIRSVAGPDASGYAREDDTVWLCVCGRANRTSDESCRRCGRGRKAVLSAFSKEVIDATLGEKERTLEAKSQENLRRSAEQNAKAMEAQQARQKKQKKRIRRIITLLVLLIAVLAFIRWGVPAGADFLAKDRLNNGKPADAKRIYEWIGQYWPDEYDAGAKALNAEHVIIKRLIEMNAEDTLRQAQTEAQSIADTELYTEASLALSQRYIDLGKTAEAESLLKSLSGTPAADALLRELLYDEAKAAKEKLEFDRAAALFKELGTYMDSDEQLKDTIYLQARQLMREGNMEAAMEKFLQVADYLDSLALLRRCRYALAGQKRENGDLIEAAELYESLGIYESAEELGRACRYEAGTAALSAGDLERAATLLRQAENYEDAPERFAEAAFTLGNSALQEGDYEAAVAWLEQLPMTDEVQKAYYEAVYALAGQREHSGAREEAALLYASLGDYEDALQHVHQIEYDLARSLMTAGAFEEALDRFEGLGKYQDSQDQAENCRREIAEKAYTDGEYEKAVQYYEQLKDQKAAAQQIVRCRYAMAEKAAGEKDYLAAAELYAQCGAYLDAEEKTVEMRYSYAESLEQDGRYEAAAEAFRALGGYLDAAARTEHCEDLWLGAAYREATLDIETGNYLSAIEALEPYAGAALPERYKDIPKLLEDACLGRALELIEIGHPLEALPYFERIPGNKVAKKHMEDYVYRIIGRWKDRNGMEYVFRRDGSCTIDGKDGWFGGSGYDIFVGDEPYPGKRTYLVVNLRGSTLTLKDYVQDKNLRLTYVGEPTPKAETDDGISADPEPAGDDGTSAGLPAEAQ